PVTSGSLGPLGNGSARRNLFGPVDRDQLRVECQDALSKDLEEASRRWGFDFISDKPMENSHFQWEGVPGSQVPLVYRSCTLEPQQPARAAEATLKAKGSRVPGSPSEKENIPCSPKRCPMEVESLEKTPEKRESTVLKRKQTNITDFYQAKRRVVGMPRKS
uniref:Cyclin dependent kinase inhibitor 1A n=1 Tax=Tetraodon nigroviridis TaxID=99883 RepID=H3DAY0_TETNG